MSFQVVAAYVAGVATGWIARSTLGSTREVAVRAFTLALDVKARLNRLASEQAEWLEDMLAEARARHEAGLDQQPRRSHVSEVKAA
jgi:hypothetical protein